MAEVQLSRADAEGGGLPPVCMQCGAPATTQTPRKYSTDAFHLPFLGIPEPGWVGCLFLPLWAALVVVKLISWSTATTMTVRTPLCHKHAHRWFTWSSLEAKSITEQNIVLAGVSEAFVTAWRQRPAPERSPDGGTVQVRCRSCRALNDEAARFCNQCGAAM